jgi:hypothetical protein
MWRSRVRRRWETCRCRFCCRCLSICYRAAYLLPYIREHEVSDVQHVVSVPLGANGEVADRKESNHAVGVDCLKAESLGGQGQYIDH